MPAPAQTAVAVIGIDIGKNSFHFWPKRTYLNLAACPLWAKTRMCLHVPFAKADKHRLQRMRLVANSRLQVRRTVGWSQKAPPAAAGD